MLWPNGSWSVTCIELWYHSKGSRVWSSVLVSVNGRHGHVSEEVGNSVCGESQVSSVQDAVRGQCNGIQWNNSGHNRADFKILCCYWQWYITIPKKISITIFSYELCTEFGFTQHTVMEINTRTVCDERNELRFSV